MYTISYNHFLSVYDKIEVILYKNTISNSKNILFETRMLIITYKCCKYTVYNYVID